VKIVTPDVYGIVGAGRFFTIWPPLVVNLGVFDGDGGQNRLESAGERCSGAATIGGGLGKVWRIDNHRICPRTRRTTRTRA